MLVIFPRQQWLSEGVSMLRYTNIASLFKTTDKRKVREIESENTVSVDHDDVS
jgi:hypothetical protein